MKVPKIKKLIPLLVIYLTESPKGLKNNLFRYDKNYTIIFCV